MAKTSSQPVQALYDRAMALQRAGRSDEALAAYTALILKRPSTPEAHFQVGRIHASEGRLSKAATAWKKAQKLKPEEPAILHEMLKSLGRSGFVDALKANAPDVLARQGALLMRTGRPSVAEALLRRAAGKGSQEAAWALAALMLSTCRPGAAAKLYAKHPPKSAEDGLRQIHALAAGGDVEAALSVADRLLRRVSQPVPIALQASGLLAPFGDGAKSILDAQLSRSPEAADLWVARGQAHSSAGDIPAAEADFARAFELNPHHGEAFRALTAARKVTPDDNILDRIDRALATKSMPDFQRWRLHFGRAKALADLGRHSDVFPELHRANALQRKAFPYDFEAAVKMARHTLAQFRDRLAKVAPEGPSDRVIFVSGMPRSGTTLVETIFAAHAEVIAGGELPLLGEALAPALDQHASGELEPGAFAAAGERYLKVARQRIGATGIFTDKAIGTFTRIGPALLALPGAKIFMLNRDPRDIGLSIYRLMFADGRHRFSNNLKDIGRYIRLQQAMVAAWQELIPDAFIPVSYEALTSAPDIEVPKLVAAAGLDWDENCLAPQNAERQVATLSFAQVRRPINRDAVAGWRRYEADLAPLLEGLETEITLL